MIFKSYMDETGIQGGAPYCTIGGFIGPIGDWESLERDWKFVLDSYMPDLPEKERYFHALEFYGDNKKYRRWKKGKKRSLEDALFEVINQTKILLFSSTVDNQLFLSMTEDERRFLTGGIHDGMRWRKDGARRLVMRGVDLRSV